MHGDVVMLSLTWTTRERHGSEQVAAAIHIIPQAVRSALIQAVKRKYNLSTALLADVCARNQGVVQCFGLVAYTQYMLQLLSWQERQQNFQIHRKKKCGECGINKYGSMWGLDEFGEPACLVCSYLNVLAHRQQEH